MLQNVTSIHELQEALEALKAGPPLAPSIFAGLVVTGTGFWGPQRAAIRELARLARLEYSGDLVSGWSTHLVLAPETAGSGGEAAAASGTCKLQKAAEWGIPCVRLRWLLHSIAARCVQPVEPYLLQQPAAAGKAVAVAAAGQLPGWHTAETAAAAAAAAQQQQQQHNQAYAAAPNTQLLKNRPSSVASNAAAGAAAGTEQAQQQQEKHPRQRPCHHRAALSPVDNLVLADQLRRMSISPEPPPAAMGPAANTAVPAAVVPGVHWPADSPPQQRSPSLGSPQHSLSLQDMAGAAGLPSVANLPAEVDSSASQQGAAAAAVAAAGRQWQPEAQSPDWQEPMQHDGAQQPAAGFSPMQHQSPEAGSQHSWRVQQQEREQQRQGARASPEDGDMRASPFAFSLAAALGRSVTDEMCCSPMAGSPAAAPPAAEALPASLAGDSGGAAATAAGMSFARGNPAGTPADDAEGGGEPLCTLPTPACIRDWSDDDTITGSPAAAPSELRAAEQGGSPLLGVTQTPPAVRQALEASEDPTQYAPPAQQQQQQQVLQQQQQQQQQQQGPCNGSEMVRRVRPAVQGWLDDETVASEPAGEMVVSDSEPEHDDMSPAQQQQQRPQQQEQNMPPLAQQPPQHMLPPLQPQQQQQQRQPKRLLQVSRLSAVQPASSAPLQPAQPSPLGCTPGPAATPAVPHSHHTGAAPPAAHSEPGAVSVDAVGVDADDEPMPSPCGSWDPVHPSTSGRGASTVAGADKSPGSAARPGDSTAGLGATASLHRQQQKPASSSSAAPQVDEHLMTSSRAGGGGGGGGARHPHPSHGQPQRQQRSVRDWSDDDSSSDEFPTPTGHRNVGGLTGLTQLDPISIIIARPKPSASTATWRGADGSSQGSGGMLGMKFLQRPPRGNAVREHHGLPNLKAVQFAEQVQVQLSMAGLILSTKDKKTAVRLQPGGLTEEEADDCDFKATSSGGRRGSSSSAISSGSRVGGGQAAGPWGQQEQRAQHQERRREEEKAEKEPVLAEPQTFYRLPDGSWWLEYCRFYTAAQAEEAATAAGRVLQLPPGFDRSCELLRAVAREHAPMGDVAGGVQVRRVKQGGTMLRLRKGGAAGASRSFFWRTAVDTSTWRALTDRPSADFVAIE